MEELQRNKEVAQQHVAMAMATVPGAAAARSVSLPGAETTGLKSSHETHACSQRLENLFHHGDFAMSVRGE